MTINKFQDLYVTELQEARSFEEMLTKALPRMAEKASDERLKTAFKEHLEETREHREKVEALLKKAGAEPKAHSDQSMERLVAEGEKMAGMVEKGPLCDAALIASAQRVEHYEMAVYGTLAAYAETLGLSDDKEMLASILEEEKDCDDLLSDIGVGNVNPMALQRNTAA